MNFEIQTITFYTSNGAYYVSRYGNMRGSRWYFRWYEERRWHLSAPQESLAQVLLKTLRHIRQGQKVPGAISRIFCEIRTDFHDNYKYECVHANYRDGKAYASVRLGPISCETGPYPTVLRAFFTMLRRLRRMDADKIRSWLHT